MLISTGEGKERVGRRRARAETLMMPHLSLSPLMSMMLQIKEEMTVAMAEVVAMEDRS